jgi:hypothetical protein
MIITKTERAVQPTKPQQKIQNRQKSMISQKPGFQISTLKIALRTMVITHICHKLAKMKKPANFLTLPGKMPIFEMDLISNIGSAPKVWFDMVARDKSTALSRRQSIAAARIPGKCS